MSQIQQEPGSSGTHSAILLWVSYTGRTQDRGRSWSRWSYRGQWIQDMKINVTLHTGKRLLWELFFFLIFIFLGSALRKQHRPGVVARTFNSAPVRLRQVDLSEFQVRLFYKVNSRIARVSETLSQRKGKGTNNLTPNLKSVKQ